MLTLDPLSRFIPLARNAFGVVSVFHHATSAGRKIFEAWDPLDRPLLRDLLVQFQKLAAAGRLKLSAHCTHLKGAGGVKRALSEIDIALRTGKFTHICRSDAKSYYASIRHDILLQQLAKLSLPGGLQKWVAAYCQRTLHYGGLYAQSSRGISQGGALSPMLGAIYLTPLDDALSALPGIFYRRYMDDWIILAKNRWALRRAVRVMNVVLTELDLRQHPDKTWIGRIDQAAGGNAEAVVEVGSETPVKTFDFLGMAFSRDGLCALGGTTPDRVREVTSQVYDRIVREVKQSSSSGQAETARPNQAELLRRVETYRKNWQRYLKGILAGLKQHRGAEAAAALYTQLCEQHRQLSSPQQWVTHFPLPRWQVNIHNNQTSEIVNYETKKKYYRHGGRCMHAADY